MTGRVANWPADDPVLFVFYDGRNLWASVPDRRSAKVRQALELFHSLTLAECLARRVDPVGLSEVAE